MAAEADKYRKLDFEEIQIPPGPRLGSVVVETKNLTKGFGDRVLIDDLSFTLPRNGIVGVVGPNGAGKTTLFKMLVGEEKPDDGEIKVGETVKLSYVEQDRSGLDPKKTLWEVVSDGLDHAVVGDRQVARGAGGRHRRLTGRGNAESPVVVAIGAAVMVGDVCRHASDHADRPTRSHRRLHRGGGRPAGDRRPGGFADATGRARSQGDHAADRRGDQPGRERGRHDRQPP